jgi:hypothetical protein
MVSDYCSIHTETIAGWQALVLESNLIRVAVLPQKGADICSFIHKPSSVDVLAKTPWQLQPPDAPQRQGSGDLEFLWNYEGGWQELFPNVNASCVYRDQRVPFHGEVATLAWEHEIVRADAGEILIRFSVRCRRTPFRLERQMRLKCGAAEVSLEEQVTNESAVAEHFVWGHHCVIGAPFLEAGCQLHIPARTIITPPAIYEQSARLVPGQRNAWPMAQRRDGNWVSLDLVRGPEARSHDDAYLTDLTGGWAAVHNPRLDLTFSLQWDPAIFKWIVSWQAYGGEAAMPLTALYALGIEPWVTAQNLEQAVAAGQAIELAAGATFRTSLLAGIHWGNWEPQEHG